MPAILLGIERLSQCPLQFSAQLRHLQRAPLAEKKAFILQLADQVVESCTLNDIAITFQPTHDGQDYVHNYARMLCHFGSLVMEFRNAGLREMVNKF